MTSRTPRRPPGRRLASALACGALVAAAGCDLGAKETVQVGYRGLGQEQVYDQSQLGASLVSNAPPATLPPAGKSPPGPLPWKNVQVLNDISVTEFNRTMLAMTQWVSPAKNQGCAYCHNVANFASDSLYPKVVARRMLQMTKHINEHWKSHVGEAGVTCYTCHRGNPVPLNVWAEPPANDGSRGRGFTADSARQNLASASVGLASLPYDIFTPYFQDAGDIRVNGSTPLAEGNRHTIKQAEWTYGLMMHFSQALNVNCTYCHNSRAFSDWSQSSPQRTNAWHGIRMVRDVNMSYINPLQPVFPASRLGPNGDPLKANCTTCHQGAYKPLYGAHMLQDHPELNLVQATPAPSEEARR